ncbi:phosphate ABC transporter substrate-binding protein [Enhygromyxa salina]|uniref:Phosphate-binding protein n=1 Tax=Enhygromyxa salina TaxID=215803 RepID=A0A2S9Y7N3_9BACT|nr:phosphate ABC transporter substrate-binding protein [Enhygromyxa salina]PRQ01105.1 Phosphate-binding protein PstS precursor [Enhygromyxa salina]
MSTQNLLLSLAAMSMLAGSACGRGSSGRTVIQNKGSDTLVNVAQAWAEEYAKVDPNTVIAVTGGGSGTGISAMINGTVDIANSSRKMKDEEIALAKKNGVDPVEHIVGYDALAVFVHKDNPLRELTIAQLASIYGEGGGVDKWSDLGITVPGCSSDEIVLVSRQNNSGTYAYFRSAVLGKEVEYKLGSRDMHGSKDVVDLVEKTPCAIGYSGLAYATDEIVMPCVKKDDAAPCIAPTIATASDESYPIARPLLMYTSGKPSGALEKYLNWVLSDTGQCIMKDKGYAPVNAVSCG